MLWRLLQNILVLVGCVLLAYVLPWLYILVGVSTFASTFVILGHAFAWQGMWKDLPAATALGLLWPALMVAAIVHVARVHINARIDA